MRSVWRYHSEAKAEKQQQQLQEQHRELHHAARAATGSKSGGSTLQTVMSAALANKLGVCFSGAGFGGAYQLGAAHVLQQLGLLSSATPVAGNMRSVWKYNTEVKAEKRQQQQVQQHRDSRHAASISAATGFTGGGCSIVQAVMAAALTDKLGVCFTSAGFGGAYQLGAAQVLQQLGLLGSTTPVAGASAGSIVAVSTRCSLPPLEVLEALNSIAQDLLKHGEKQRMRGVLASKIEQLLPRDAYLLCSGSSKPGSNAHYHITRPQHDPVSVQQGSSSSTYSTTAAAVGASSSSNGSSSNSRSGMDQAPCVLGATQLRPCSPICMRPDVFMGGYASNSELLDALMAGAHIPRTSDGSMCTPFRGHRYIDAGIRDPCPPIPGVDYTIIIYPVPSRLFRRKLIYKLLLKPPPPEAVAISPGQYGRPWPYSRDYKQSNKLVMHPQPTGVLHMLFERGRRDALAWAQHIGLTAQHIHQLHAAKHKRVVGPAAAAAPAGHADNCCVEGDVAKLLATRPDELPMLVHVPDSQLHFL